MATQQMDENAAKADAFGTERSSTQEGSPAPLETLTAEEEKRLVRKIDMRVMPILFLIYVAAFLDRVNISNALTMSLPKDLGLTGQQPNIALTIFFVPYVLFEVPSNILLKRFNPHIWLSGCILAFGLIMLCQGFVQNYAGLMATRFFLGLAEAGIFPGSFYLISFWYSQKEAQKRFTVYWSSVIMAGAFGGLLASAIANMNGVRGLANWRWIFILEGMVTMLIGIAAFFLVSDFPREANWLTPAERHFVLAKTRSNEPHRETISRSDLATFFKNPKHIFAAVMYFGIVVPIYAFAYFAPTIIKTLGYGTIQIQLHAVPPFAAALALSLIFAVASDRLRLRAPFVFFGQILVVVSLAMLLTLHGKGYFSAEYAAICLLCMGSFSAGASIICWYLMNLQGHAERSIGSAWMIGFGNTGGILATFTFLSKDAPYYHTGYSILLAMTLLGMVSAVGYYICVMKERKALAAGDEKDRVEITL